MARKMLLRQFGKKKNNCLDLQPKEQGVAKTTSCSTEFISVLLNCTCCEFLLLNVAVAHHGEEETTYDNITMEKICQSMSHADVKNHHRHYPAKNHHRHYPVMNDEDAIKDFPDRNFEITEAEMELIDKFLNV